MAAWPDLLPNLAAFDNPRQPIVGSCFLPICVARDAGCLATDGPHPRLIDT